MANNRKSRSNHRNFSNSKRNISIRRARNPVHKNSHRRNTKQKRRNFRKPKSILDINSQILNGISFIIIGILLLRFSTYIFIQLFLWGEGIFWGYLIGAGFILGGILSLIAWWRNHVSMLTTNHNIKWN